ncbi:BglG family transcription antiterminator [Paenibacillus hamazuiensis]|uniref:BglG family transcription antiterminator n=1 Tax=Paenibacillus hamazuiensis TaxID=2936508 RepID=UPI00200FCCAC|nr:BglG family transcription antiterminator [Paenibacillus hamazuiensis]
MSQHQRRRQIVELLLSRQDEITAGEIASEIGVSTRTVHRELAELEAILESLGLTLKKKTGKGIQLQGDPERLDALRRTIHGETVLEYTAHERKLYILCMLLTEDEPVKLFTLSHELGVSIPTVTHDLNELDEMILKANLLLVRRRGYGVELTGAEAGKRRLIRLLAMQYLDESDLFGKNPPSPQSAEGKLLALIGKEHFAKVEAALWHAEEIGVSKLEEAEYMRLLIGISIAIARMGQGKHVELNAEHGSMQDKELVSRIVRELTETIPAEFTTAEIAHIASLLEPKNAAADPNELLPAEELYYMEIVRKLIRNMERRSGSRFSEDRTLRDGLLRHLESAIKRLRSGARIRNPLLGQIKKDYEELFDTIRLAVDETMPDLDVPDEEIGFLVMHFGASLERQKQFGRSVRAFIVCTSGIGTSNMLAVRLTNELPQVEIVGHASWFEAARIPESEYDLIISTIDLPLPEHRYMKLSPLLTKEEAERLRLFIQNVTLQHQREAGVQEEKQPAAHKMDRIRRYMDEIGKIIDQFAVYELEQPFTGLQATLEAMCGYVQRAGTIEEVGPIVQLLLERERQSSQIIPDLGIALFHIRSEKVKAPSFTLFRLKEDLQIHDKGPTGVRQLLLMLGPKELSKESLEVLSEISSFLINPEMIELLKTGSQAEIKQFLSEELAVFVGNKK